MDEAVECVRGGGEKRWRKKGRKERKSRWQGRKD